MKKLIRKISNFLFLAAIPVWIIALIVNFYYSPLNALQGVLGMIGAIVISIITVAAILFGVVLWTGKVFSEFSEEEKNQFIDSFYALPITLVIVALVDYWFLGWVSSLSFFAFWGIAYKKSNEFKELITEEDEIVEG